jgi:hypothetical protein
MMCSQVVDGGDSLQIKGTAVNIIKAVVDNRLVMVLNLDLWCEATNQKVMKCHRKYG